MFGQMAGLAANLWSMRSQMGEMAAKFQRLQTDLANLRFSATSGPVQVEVNGLLHMTNCEIQPGYREADIARCTIEATNEAMKQAQAAATKETQSALGDLSMLQGLLGGKLPSP